MTGCACLAYLRHYFPVGLHNMYKLGIVIAMCCAFCPRGSAAPKTLGADPRSQLESNAEQNERLQEEIDGQESILSQVGALSPFFISLQQYFYGVCFFFHHFVPSI